VLGNAREGPEAGFKVSFSSLFIPLLGFVSKSSCIIVGLEEEDSDDPLSGGGNETLPPAIG